jgi:hypothetical protein
LWQNSFGTSHVLISDKGNAVVVMRIHPNFYPAKSLDFYNSKGELVGHVDTDVINSVRLSPEGDKAYLATHSSVSAYSTQGNRLWEHATWGNDIFLSENGEFLFNVQVAAHRESSSIEIYSNQGLLLGMLRFAQRCALLGISSDSRFIAIREKKKLHLFDVDTQELKWTYDLETDLIPDFGVMGLNAADVGTDAKLTAIIVSGSQKVGPRPKDYEFSNYIRILNSKGHKIFERFLEKTGRQIQVKMSLGSGLVTAWTGKNMYTFKIERQ